MNSLRSLVQKLQPGHQIPDRAKPKGEMIDPGAVRVPTLPLLSSRSVLTATLDTQILAEWGLRVESEPLAVQGRQVQLETLRIGAKAPKTLGGKSTSPATHGRVVPDRVMVVGLQANGSTSTGNRPPAVLRQTPAARAC